MDFLKPENTTSTTPSTTTTTAKRMMMMMKNKSSSSSSSPQKNSNNFDDHHHHQQCSDNTTADQHEETPITEEKKQKRYTNTPTTSSKRYSANSGSGSSGGGGGGVVSCQAEKCTADLGEAKRYHRRHKVCEFHAKAPSVLVSGLRQRFCQQCSRFHELSEFDETKRSCRRRLAGHNERRRKNSMDQGEGGSSSQTKGSSPQIRAGEHERSNAKSQISYAGTTNNNGTTSFKQFQIR